MKCPLCGKENVNRSTNFEDGIEWWDCPDCESTFGELPDPHKKKIIDNLIKGLIRNASMN